jgi:hypothetical protein
MHKAYLAQRKETIKSYGSSAGDLLVGVKDITTED